MLPSLVKTYNRQDSLSNNQSSVKVSQQVKVYDPPFEVFQTNNNEKEETQSFVYSSKKIKYQFSKLEPQRNSKEAINKININEVDRLSGPLVAFPSISKGIIIEAL